MNWNRGIRQTHRWLSILFTVTVVIATAAGVVQEQPALWVYYLPLPPLGLLTLTGLYLYVLPYGGKRRREQSTNRIDLAQKRAD